MNYSILRDEGNLEEFIAGVVRYHDGPGMPNVFSWRGSGKRMSEEKTVRSRHVAIEWWRRTGRMGAHDR